MRKLIFVIGVLMTSACSSVQRPGAVPVVGPRASMWKQEVMVELTNNCAPILHVVDGNITRLVLRGSGTHYVKLERGQWKGDGGVGLHVTVKAYAYEGEAGYLGSAEGRWYVDSHNAGYRVPWQLDYLQSVPKGSSGCTGFRTGMLEDLKQWVAQLLE